MDPFLVPSTSFEHEISRKSKALRQNNLSELLSTLPDEQQQILGEISYKNEHFHHILQSFGNGNLICGSDRSFVCEDNIKKGTHAFSIQSINDNTGTIKGSAYTPLSTTMSSLTVETYGILANLLILKIISTIIKDDTRKPIILLICDNKEVINRCQKEPETIKSNQTMVPEYDLWKMLWDIIPTINANLKFTWQPGHMDELETGEKIYGPFQRAVQINIENDRDAGSKMKHHTDPLQTSNRRPLYPHTKVGFYSKDGIFIGNVRQYLLNQINGKNLLRYLNGKYG